MTKKRPAHAVRQIKYKLLQMRSWSAKRNVAILDAPKGRRDAFVAPYFKGAEPDAVVVVLKAREPAP